MGSPYDTTVQQHREKLEPEKKKLEAETEKVKGESERSKVIGEAAKGIHDTFAGLGQGTGLLHHNVMGLNKRAADLIARPFQKAGAMAGDFVGRHEGKVRDFLHNKGKRPSRFGP